MISNYFLNIFTPARGGVVQASSALSTRLNSNLSAFAGHAFKIIICVFFSSTSFEILRFCCAHNYEYI
jgi:hypothetical protein